MSLTCLGYSHYQCQKEVWWLDDLTTILVEMMGGFNHKIIMGNFNEDQLQQSFDAQHVKLFISNCSLKLVHHGATNVTNQSDTLLDLSVIDNQDQVISFDKSR